MHLGAGMCWSMEVETHGLSPELSRAPTRCRLVEAEVLWCEFLAALGLNVQLRFSMHRACLVGAGHRAGLLLFSPLLCCTASLRRIHGGPCTGPKGWVLGRRIAPPALQLAAFMDRPKLMQAGHAACKPFSWHLMSGHDLPYEQHFSPRRRAPAAVWMPGRAPPR